ncbi:hypothetical protein FGG08_004828 [Glutinoglossum americanum]|uniref:Rhodopsin domain-containing protein n=1 Tax=Glutinoglossum americanum TaxID=1670608 RepID=A0A9P8HVN6_9PEZI|nr:hypothetical protein FGG08_004828 [Glutinoglossum americanum]
MSDTTFATRFAIETWTLFGTGMLIIVLRMFARIRRLGVSKLQTDDWLMINAGIWYTLLCLSLNMIASGGGSNLMSQEEIDALTPETIAERVRGSKWVIARLGLKEVVLTEYGNSNGLKQRNVIIWLAYYVGAGFIGCELAMFLSCRPFHDYWSVPAREEQCSTYQHYVITELCFNISSDLAMLIVALPLLFSAQLRGKQKVIVCIIFGMGVFVIAAAVITKIYSLDPQLLSLVYIFWYFREATVAVYVTNLPLLWSLLLDVFPGLKRWVGRNGTTGRSGYGGGTVGLESGLGHSQLQSSNGRDYPLSSVGRTGKGSITDDDDDSFERSQSQERINRRQDEDGVSETTVTEPQHLGISKEVTFSVEQGPGSVSRSSSTSEQGGGGSKFDMASQGGNKYTTQVQGGGGRLWPEGWKKSVGH